MEDRTITRRGLRALGVALWVFAACGDNDGDKDGSTGDTAADTSSDTATAEVTAPDTTPPVDTEVPEVEDDTTAEVEDDTTAEVEDDTTAEVEDDTVAEVEDDTVAEVEDDTTAEVEDDTSPPEDTTPPADTEVPETVAETIDDTTTADIDDGETGPVDPCSTEPALPLEFETLEGFTGGEDFAFYDKWAYSVDMNGNLVRDTTAGTGSLVLPNLSGFAAGMAMLPDGRLAVNDAEDGALVLVTIAPPPGNQVTKVTLLGGLSYPNGLDVDQDGFLYVAEQDAGRVRRVDPNDGTYEIIAENLMNPNGVSFGPGYRRLYVGSFGGGVVWAIDRNDAGTWETPFVYLAVPGFGEPATPLNTCKGNAKGDWCYTTSGIGGQCDIINGQIQCVPDPNGADPLVEICAHQDPADPCSIKIAGVTYGGTCIDSGFGGLSCTIEQSISQPCFHSVAGKPCVSFQFGAPFFGVCTDADDIPPEWGYPPTGLFCIQPSGGEGGGLDGLNVDACGTVYVTEYILGRVWRKKVGGQPEIAVELPAQWIPNMHWGNGIGGWDTTTLWVADRDQGRMFGLHIGRSGKHTVLP